jgi:NAD(P)-dependent dehydrogenase (short-subunit alcohol dehydrogenase family)
VSVEAVSATDRPSLPTPDPRELAGMVALVTAAAGDGIGQTTARRLAAGGATIVVTDAHERRLGEVVEAIRRDHDGRATGIVLDVSERSAVRGVVDQVAERLGRLDVLVNNAALNHREPIFDYPEDRWDALLEANLTAPWLLTRHAMGLMRAGGRGGSVVNVSSYAADIGGHGTELPYAITKGGLHVLTRAAAREGGPHGIRCNTVSMTVVRGTRFIERSLAATPDRRPGGLLPGWIWPEDVAEAVAFLCSSRARMITGSIVDVTAGEYMRT